MTTIIHVAVRAEGANQWNFLCLCNDEIPAFDKDEHWYEPGFLFLVQERNEDLLCQNCEAHPDYPLIILGDI